MNLDNYTTTLLRLETFNKNNSFKQIQKSINQFQVRLQQKINKVVKNLISNSKLHQLHLPSIDNQHSQKTQSTYQKSSYINTNGFAKKNRVRSINVPSVKSHLNETLFNEIKTQLDQNFKASQKSLGRAIGNKKYAKPKSIKKNIDIIPKHIRNNPFSQPLPVSVNQINKGLFTLLNKGVIAKDVDISTAFQRGDPPIKSKVAVLHHFQQKLVKQQTFNELTVEKQNKFKINLKEQYQTSANWAITGIQVEGNKNRTTFSSKMEIKKQKYIEKSDKNAIINLQIYHIEFRNYAPILNQTYHNLKIKYYSKFGQINSFFRQISKFMKKYSLSLLFVDAKKVIQYCGSMKKIKEKEILDCILQTTQEKLRLVSFKSIQDIGLKKQAACRYLLKYLRMHMIRKQWVRQQKKKTSGVKIMNWLYRIMKYRKTKKIITEKITKEENLTIKIQQKFKLQYEKIKSNKHYQIHIPNQFYDYTLQSMIQKLNVQITRIFNIHDPLVHIIYVCPFALSTDITNYYYKILELGEISNYKQRITFVQSDPTNFFKYRFSNSKRLYYCSSSLKKIKQIVKDTPAYIITSTPEKEDTLLSAFFGFPILSNYQISLKLNLRTQSLLKFKKLFLNTLPSIVIEQRSMQIADLLTKVNKLFYETKAKRFICKINNTNNSTGLAVINYPIINFDDFLNKTTVLATNYYFDARTYFAALLEKGGIVERYEPSFNSISVSLFFNPTDSECEILGTFDRIANNMFNVAYNYPQRTVLHLDLMREVDKIKAYLKQSKYYGYADINFVVDAQKNIHFQKINCYLTKSTSSIFYFRYLMGGRFQNNGIYLANVSDTIAYQNNHQNSGETIEPRTYLYSPIILHFGLSQMQIKNFFQLCRIQGVSFDLEKKFGSTFILIDSLKSSIGLLTTGKHPKIAAKLMIMTLNFLLKQNYRSSNETTKEKQLKYRQKCNIAAIKARVQQLMLQFKPEDEDENT